MVFDVTKYKSHPDKFLLTQPDGEKGHVNGVIDNVKKLTNSKVGELIAIFHDLGKLNSNFQDKLESGKKVNGYSNHAYLSAYTFWAFCQSKYNLKCLCKFFGYQRVTSNQIISWIILIAKHHGNLPDFDTPDGFSGSSYNALSTDELKELFRYISSVQLAISSYTKTFTAFNEIEDFEQFFFDKKVQHRMLEKFKFCENGLDIALDFFLETQFYFACLIQADKADAARHDNLIDNSQKNKNEFCNYYPEQLNQYLANLSQETPLNRLRTEIRKVSIANIEKGLKENRRVFELTSPTGSGKTLMLLSLASEIIKVNGGLRIIYALPFLSITEQVEGEVLKIFSESKDYIRRIDSKSENRRFDELQEELDNDPTEEKIQELNLLEFQENTFAYPFVITTFVRFFETLLSNRNSDLLKLPNFSRGIFLLDEIQSLPPRLYGFLVAYLTKFCEKFNSYAIISTATQPNFELPKKSEAAINAAKEFFFDYTKPYPLLSLKYFENDLFNRYHIYFNKEIIELETLKNQITGENNSVLVILNTIDDTKDLHRSLLEDGYSKDEVLLLNTHFTPQHRKLKIYLAKRKLKQNKRVILVSTQLIEAGVDIDFPILYRDFATVASIVQSAGRCNRNGNMQQLGNVKLVRLKNRNKIRSELIYQGKDKDLLTFTKDSFTDAIYEENALLNVQRVFFNRIQEELNFAKHTQQNPKKDFDFLKDIQQAQFKKIGSFQMIDNELFGKETQYFVQKNEQDKKFEVLLEYKENLHQFLKTQKDDRNGIQLLKNKIKNQLKKMAGQIVQVRSKNKHEPLKSSTKDYYGLFTIASSSYSFEKGIDLKGDDCII